jgi:hypothetical protein
MQTYVSTYLYLQIIHLSELQKSQFICIFRTKCSTMSLWQVCGIEISSIVKTSLEFEKKSGFQHRDWYTLHSVENSIHGFHYDLRLNKDNLPSVLTHTPLSTVFLAKRARCFSLKVSVTTKSVRYLYPSWYTRVLCVSSFTHRYVYAWTWSDCEVQVVIKFSIDLCSSWWSRPFCWCHGRRRSSAWASTIFLFVFTLYQTWARGL